MSTIQILAIGDIVGPAAVDHIKQKLWKYRSENNIALVVANAENACTGNGLDPEAAQAILDSGVDVITSGNHIWQKKSIYETLDEKQEILRPLNYPAGCPGNGYIKYLAEGKIYLVMNVMGIIFTEPLDCPFNAVEEILKKESGNYDYTVLDVHAEATSEKIALAYYFDGRINVVFGTHTHVATADEQILPNGTGYITDIGMTGPINSALGIKTECIIDKLKNKLPTKFEIAQNEIECNCVLFALDTDLNCVVKVSRVKL